MQHKMLMLSLAIVFVAALLVAGVVPGCSPCKTGAMRCYQNQVQLCAPNHKWKTVVDCSRLKRTKKQHVCVELSENRCSCRAKREP